VHAPRLKLTPRSFPRADRHSHLTGMTLDLTDEEAEALVRHLRSAIANDRFPLAPRHAPIKAILAKLEPPMPTPEPLPPLKPGMGPTHGQGGRRR
jgi:hypothetical protein